MEGKERNKKRKEEDKKLSEKGNREGRINRPFDYKSENPQKKTRKGKKKHGDKKEGAAERKGSNLIRNQYKVRMSPGGKGTEIDSAAPRNFNEANQRAGIQRDHWVLRPNEILARVWKGRKREN